MTPARSSSARPARSRFRSTSAGSLPRHEVPTARLVRPPRLGNLPRLRTDYVNLYQGHRYDEDTPLEETMEALTDVVRAGKARYLGFSEWTAERIQASLEIPGVEKFVSSQPQYSLLWREPEQ